MPDRGVPALRVPAWEGLPGLVHGFLGRQGGTSCGAWASLNLGRRVGDDPAAVASNWETISRVVAGTPIITPRQVHGTTVVRVREAGQAVGPPADALVTDVAGVGLGVLTADCVPLLMVAPAARVALAVHAGWRGTLEGIAAAAIAVARRDFGVEPAALHAALGPAIGGCCYEVEARIGAGIEKRWGAMPGAWRRGAGGRGMLDLRQANRAILLAAGVPAAQIAEVGPCTACAATDFFSHRRSGGRTGRQLSFVAWRREEHCQPGGALVHSPTEEDG